MNTDILNDPELQDMVHRGPQTTSSGNVKMGDLSQLCNFGSLQEEITIGPYTFVVKTLSSGEQEKALGAVAQYNIASLVVAAALQNQVLARAVVSVNGVPLKDVPFNRDSIDDKALLARVDADDVHARKLAVILSWQDGLRQQLFQFHQDLATRSEGIISGVSPEDLKD